MLSTAQQSRAIRKQLKFFAEKKAGCLFAAVAARNPRRYGWVHLCVSTDATELSGAIAAAIADPATTTASFLFPDVTTPKSLLELIEMLRTCEALQLDAPIEHEGSLCFGFRAKIGPLLSWVTGFGPFDFFPATRRAPYVELTMRVKPRPAYDFVFKEAPPGILHLADLDMLGIKRERLWHLWDNSHVHTEAVLGAKPDLRSAAKTTFSIPRDIAGLT